MDSTFKNTSIFLNICENVVVKAVEGTYYLWFEGFNLSFVIGWIAFETLLKIWYYIFSPIATATTSVYDSKTKIITEIMIYFAISIRLD